MFQKNIRSFLSRQGHYIGRKTPSLHSPARQGQNVFLSTLRHWQDFGHRRNSPFLPICCPYGLENNIFQPGFFKNNEYYIFYTLPAGIVGTTFDNHYNKSLKDLKGKICFRDDSDYKLMRSRKMILIDTSIRLFHNDNDFVQIAKVVPDLKLL